MLISLMFFGFSCNKSAKAKDIVVDIGENVWYELGTDAKIPNGKIMDKNGKEIVGRLNYTFVSPDGTQLSSKSPYVYCDKTGKWSVTYSFGNISKIKYFEVKDTVAPVITLSDAPGDVFADGTTSYKLPTDTEEDLSEIDWDTLDISLTLNGKDAEFNENTRMFKAAEAGEFRYKISVADIHGNYAESETLVWNAKIKNWQDEDLPTGYLASYDDAEYINSVVGGTLSDYWRAVPYEMWFNEYAGAKGVIKVSAPPYGIYKCVGFKFNLQKVLTESEMQNKCVVIKLMTDNNVSELFFGGVKWIDVMECAENFPFAVKQNEWKYLVLDLEKLKICHYFDEGEKGFDSFQIGFGLANVNAMYETCNLYIDSVTVAETLPKVGGITDDGETISWNEVVGATGYEVIENGVSSVVTTTSYKPKSVKSALSVRAIAENSVFYVSAKNTTPYVNTDDLKDGYLANYSSAAYESTVGKSEIMYRDAAEIRAEYLECFEGAEGVLKVTSVNNDVFEDTGIGDIVLTLPKTVNKKATIRFYIEECDAEYISFLIPDTEEIMLKLDNSVKGWQIVELIYSGLKTKDKISIMIQGGAAGSENVFYFDYVYEDTVIEKPYEGEDVATGKDKKEDPCVDDKKW